jgi:hypothetical protein
VESDAAIAGYFYRDGVDIVTTKVIIPLVSAKSG